MQKLMKGPHRGDKLWAIKDDYLNAGGYCTKPFWGVGGWDFLGNLSYPNSVFV